MFLPKLDNMKTVDAVKQSLFNVILSHELGQVVEGKTVEEKACNMLKLPIDFELQDWLINAIATIDILKSVKDHRGGLLDVEDLTQYDKVNQEED